MSTVNACIISDHMPKQINNIDQVNHESKGASIQLVSGLCFTLFGCVIS